MGKIWRIVILLSVIAAVVAVNACTSSQCMENQTSIPLAGFYSKSTLKQVSLDSLSIYGAGVPNDSMILRNTSASQVYLPLRFTTSQSQFVIHYNQKALSDEAYNDTVTIQYNAYPYFVSEACGAMYNYDVIDYSYTKHIVDSVSILVSTFTNKDVETMQIFFNTIER